jgi:hypothetical protein
MKFGVPVLELNSCGSLWSVKSLLRVIVQVTESMAGNAIIEQYHWYAASGNRFPEAISTSLKL